MSELPSLEYRFGVPVSSQFISIKRGRQYLDEAKTNLAKNLHSMYKQLTEYLKKLGMNKKGRAVWLIPIRMIFVENDFSDVVNGKQPQDLSTCLQENHTYDELLEKLDLFQSYRNKATELVDDWNFELGK